MAKSPSKKTDELLPEYNLKELLKGGIRGKYAKSYHSGTNLVALAPDVKKAFPNDETVNDALRLVMELRKIGSSGAGSARRRA